MIPRELDVIGAGYVVVVSRRVGVLHLVVLGGECIVAAGTGPRSIDALEFVVVAVLRI
jgi:hypothetical protein